MLSFCRFSLFTTISILAGKVVFVMSYEEKDDEEEEEEEEDVIF